MGGESFTFNPFLAAMRSLHFLFLAVLMLLTACGRPGALPLASETSNGDYERAQELKRQGREQEALALFLRVIDTRGTAGAPESHLEAGVLCEQKLRDPVTAVYHYRKFLELAPTSPQAPLVRDRIDSALRDFARTLPGQPLDNQSAELLATIEALKKENAQLRTQLGQTPRQTVNIAPAPPVRSNPAPPVGPAPPPPSVNATTRKHTVASGDTLSKIAQQYYGDRSKFQQIFEANRDVMSDPNRLPKVGTELKIP